MRRQKNCVIPAVAWNAVTSKPAEAWLCAETSVSVLIIIEGPSATKTDPTDHATTKINEIRVNVRQLPRICSSRVKRTLASLTL